MGVLLHDENKLNEMSKILAHFMQFVPMISKEGELTLPNGGKLSFDDTEYFKILFGGDQLTAARIRGTQALRVTEDEAVDRLEGLIPVAEDWHSRMALVDVSSLPIPLPDFELVCCKPIHSEETWCYFDLCNGQCSGVDPGVCLVVYLAGQLKGTH
jgi:hypothetical protein